LTTRDLINLHPADVALWLHVEEATWRLVKAARLPVARVIPTKRRDVSTTHGRYEFENDVLEISLRYWWDAGKWSQRMQLHQIVDTIVHECAHAKAGWDADHGRNFFLAFGKLAQLQEKLGVREHIRKGFK
jgi:hypothetical protein